MFFEFYVDFVDVFKIGGNYSDYSSIKEEVDHLGLSNKLFSSAVIIYNDWWKTYNGSEAIVQFAKIRLANFKIGNVQFIFSLKTKEDISVQSAKDLVIKNASISEAFEDVTLFYKKEIIYKG